MRRRRITSDDVGVSLFPFLAVLLCTMGTLIVLLMVIADRARNSTDEPPEAKAAPVETSTSKEDDPTTWRRRAEQLAAAREDVVAVVEDRRARLGHLEQTTREIENKIVEFKERLAEQQRLAASDADQVAKTEAELKRLEASAAEAERNLEEIRRENTNRPATFSIVPYEGPNTTPRRPVYIECRGHEVILQPEGIVLGADDFLIASDAGNPLATVLRATREYLVTSRSLRAEEEPYPLIIVRPDAVEAYYAVRQSLQGWTTDFGYELVDRDWKLSFGPADPNLAIAQNRALAEARLRQSSLVAMLRRRANKNPTYRPAARGGIVRDGHETGVGVQSIPYHGEEADASDDDGTREFAAAGRGGRGSEVGRDGAGQHGAGQSSAGQRGSGALSEGAAANRIGGLNGGRYGGEHATGSGTEAANVDRFGSPGTADGDVARGVARGDAHQALQPADVRSPRAGENGAREPNENNLANRGSQAAPGGGAAGGSASPNVGEGGSSGGGSSGGSAASPGGSEFSSGAPDPTARHESARFDAESLANRRGRDWGLRYAAPSATPVTRPLRVVCFGDRAIIHSDDPRREPRQIAFKPQTRDSTDEFVAAVWEEIKAWGIAGKGMYWRPILSFDVHADGDRRYEDLSRLLDGSGFEMRRKPTTVARRGPNRAPVGIPARRPPQSAR